MKQIKIFYVNGILFILYTDGIFEFYLKYFTLLHKKQLPITCLLFSVFAKRLKSSNLGKIQSLFKIQ